MYSFVLDVSYNLNIDVICSSETSVTTHKITYCRNLEDQILQQWWDFPLVFHRALQHLKYVPSLSIPPGVNNNRTLF
jgi:hypothetical protein